MPAIDWSAHLLYGAAWVSFGAAHSGLAGDRLKRLFGAGHRLAFNVIATVHVTAVFAVGRHLLGDAGGPPALPFLAVHLVGWALLLWSLKDYDLGRFSGLAQLRAARAGVPFDDDGPLITDGLHRHVRHPLYTAAFLILWGGASAPFGVATAVWGSAYLIAGTWSEERRLLARHGTAYADYRRRVPAFLPWRLFSRRGFRR